MVKGSEYEDRKWKFLQSAKTQERLKQVQDDQGLRKQSSNDKIKKPGRVHIAGLALGLSPPFHIKLQTIQRDYLK